MPGSNTHGKAQIREWIHQQGKDIKTIVDVGAGMANYPKLLGNQYEYTAIEIWAPYVKKFKLKKYYKKIIIGDIRYIKLPKADCIIFGAVLEHINRKDSLKVLMEANEKYKYLVLSVPESQRGKKMYYSAMHYGNWFETHRSAWYFDTTSKLLDWDFIKTATDIGIFMRKNK